MNYKIAAVVVTYNRLELLKECIQSLRNQTHKLDEIIIVNNSSTDGTLEWLNAQNDLTVITQENSGSAGGQYTGIKTAYEKEYDWIWCIDTDIILDINALKMFVESNVIDSISTGFLSSVINYTDGNLCYINIPYFPVGIDMLKSYLKYSELPTLSASFGSVLISKNAVAKVGYPIKDFFIWGDDVEYTFRIVSSGFNGYLIKSSNAIHYATNNEFNPFAKMNYKNKKSFYCVRNTVFIIKLKNKLFFNSWYRGFLGCLLFYFRNLNETFKTNKLNPVPMFLFTKYFIQGLFYNAYNRIND